MENIMKEVLPRIERQVYVSLSDDAESKAAGEARQFKLTLALDAGWTVEEVVDRLLTVTTSPRVAWQNANRGKEKPSTTYVVPKAGSRAVREITDEEALELLMKKYGEDAVAELKARMASRA